jgi:hypothetical protein
MATNNTNDISTPSVIRPQGAQDMTLNLLPTRGEKQLIPSPVTVTQASQIIRQGFSKGQSTRVSSALSVSSLQEAFELSAALEPLTDFVTIVMQNRGVDNQGNPAPSTNAVFRFLINPASVSISHSTLDSESFARSGWLFGVWGDDFVRISLSGKTPGQYFILGTTDEFAEYTESFRNLEQLTDVFENNGYWFEGESVNYGNALSSGGNVTAPSAFTRRIIKMHQDVLLTVKEFIWNGMFESFEWSQDANNPFLADFTLTFLAWTESFRSDSPYINALPSAAQRGNAYSAFSALPLPMVAPASQTITSGQPQTASPAPPGNTTATSPAAESDAIALPTVNSSIVDYSPIPSMVLRAETTYMNYLQGIL